VEPVSKRLASLILAYGVLAGLIAPAGLLAQDQPPAPAADSPAHDATATQPQTTPAPAPPQPAPAPAPAPVQPPAPVQAPPAARPAPPKTVAVTPIAVASSAGSVTIKDFAFGPSTVSVNAGDTVTWANSGPSQHSATANDGSFDTGVLSKGGSGSHTFTKGGTFGYHCSVHPFMHGTVQVQASSNGGNQGSSPSGGNSGSSTGSSSSPSSTGSSSPGAALPATGVDTDGLLIVGLGFLALGLFARRRTAS
jgi:LPXTG-motif cell wall-anchored protein